MLFIRSPDASVLAVATDTVAPASSRLTVPSAGTGAASAVDGVPSLHGRRRGRSDGFKVGGQHVVQGQRLKVIVCGGVGGRWKKQLLELQ